MVMASEPIIPLLTLLNSRPRDTWSPERREHGVMLPNTERESEPNRRTPGRKWWNATHMRRFYGNRCYGNQEKWVFWKRGSHFLTTWKSQLKFSTPIQMALSWAIFTAELNCLVSLKWLLKGLPGCSVNEATSKELHFKLRDMVFRLVQPIGWLLVKSCTWLLPPRLNVR